MKGIEEFDLRQLLVGGLYRDPLLLTLVAPDIQPEFFITDAERWLVAFALRYYAQFHTPPSVDALALELGVQREAGRIDEAQQEDVIGAYTYLDTATRAPHVEALYPFIREHAGAFIRQAAVQRALTTSIGDARGDAFDLILPRIQQALSAGQAPTTTSARRMPIDGKDWMDGYTSTPDRVYGTGLPKLDRAIGGGLHAGEVGVFLAAPSVGKSHMLVHLGRHYTYSGLHVTHVTLELSQQLTELRYLAGFVGVRAQDFRDQGDLVLSRMEERQELVRGDVMVQYAAPLTVGMLRRMIDDLKRLHDHPTDVLIVDYADEMSSPSRREESDWHEQGRVYSELRACAMDYGFPVWTATQTIREGVSARRMDLRTIGRSFEKAKIADVVVAMIPDPTPVDRENHVMDLEPLKVRNAARGMRVGVIAQYPYSRFVEVDDANPAGGGEDDDDDGGGPALARRARGGR